MGDRWRRNYDAKEKVKGLKKMTERYDGIWSIKTVMRVQKYYLDLQRAYFLTSGLYVPGYTRKIFFFSYFFW